MEILLAITLAGVVAIAWRQHQMNKTINLLSASLCSVVTAYAKDKGLKLVNLRTGEVQTDIGDLDE